MIVKFEKISSVGRFRDFTANGDVSFKDLEKVGVVQFRNETNRNQIISDLKLLNSISWEEHHGEAKPDFNALGVDPKKMSDTALASMINKTFKLIDNEL